MALYQTNPADKNATPKLVLETLGTVVEIFNQEDRVMSDVWEYRRYARYMDKDGTFKVVLMSGEYLTSLVGEVDAEDEVIAAWETSKKNAKKAALEVERDRAMEDAKRVYMTPAKGKTVKVFKGRKLPVGMEGEVKWIGETRYGVTVGIKVEGKTELQWTAIGNVKVVVTNPAELCDKVCQVEDWFNEKIAQLG